MNFPNIQSNGCSYLAGIHAFIIFRKFRFSSFEVSLIEHNNTRAIYNLPKYLASTNNAHSFAGVVETQYENEILVLLYQILV